MKWQEIVVVFKVIRGCVCFDDLLKPKELKDDEDLYNHDVGKYTTMEFSYFNNQYLNRLNVYSYREVCLDHYLRCLLSLTAPMPVCAFNNPFDREYGFYSVKSYCEIYFENCRRGNRIWRSLDHGECRFWYLTTWDHVAETRKSSKPLIFKLLKVLASLPGNFDDSLFKIDSYEWQKPLLELYQLEVEGTTSNIQGVPDIEWSKPLPERDEWVTEEPRGNIEDGHVYNEWVPDPNELPKETRGNVKDGDDYKEWLNPVPKRDKLVPEETRGKIEDGDDSNKWLKPLPDRDEWVTEGATGNVLDEDVFKEKLKAVTIRDKLVPEEARDIDKDGHDFNKYLKPLPSLDEWVTEGTTGNVLDKDVLKEKLKPVPDPIELLAKLKNNVQDRHDSNKWLKPLTPRNNLVTERMTNNDHPYGKKNKHALEDLLLSLASRVGISKVSASNVSGLWSEPMDLDSMQMDREYLDL